MLRPILMRLSRRPWRFLLPVVVLSFFFVTLSRTSHRRHSPQQPTNTQSVFYTKGTKSFFPPLRKNEASAAEPDYCANFPTKQLDDIQVVLKTGAGEKQKTRAHLATVSSCIKNLLIVSDHEDEIGEHQVVDILAELPPSYAENNPDFKSYLEHKKAHAEGDKVDYSSGWKLDRFKFLPMVDKAYETNPNAKWYFFIESDIFIFWDTLFRLLSQLDGNDLHYLGAKVPGSKGDRDFAYGGAGFVLSQGLVMKLLPQKADGTGFEKLATRFQEKVKKDCCGDAVLAYAILNTTDFRLEQLYPTFSGEDLKQLRVDKERWCVPLLSLHRIPPDEMKKLWEWERTRPFTKKEFTYSNLLAYTHSFLRQSAQKNFWDNFSEAPVPNDRPAHRNAQSCGSECAADPHCLQWSYSQTVCRFANFIKKGVEVDPNNGGQGGFESGWETGKMGELGFRVGDGAEAGDIWDTCKEATWITPKVR